MTIELTSKYPGEFPRQKTFASYGPPQFENFSLMGPGDIYLDVENSKTYSCVDTSLQGTFYNTYSLQPMQFLTSPRTSIVLEWIEHGPN